VPRLDEVIQRPFARFARASRFGNGSSGFVLGLGLGALYVPCAGPVLAAVAIAGASGRIDARIVALTLALAVGAAVPLFFFAAAGSAIGRRLAGYRRRARVFRVIGGTVMIALAAALTFGLTDALQRTVPDYTAGVQVLIEDNPAARQALAELDPAPRVSLDDCPAGRPTPADCGPAPQIAGISRWFNTDGGRALRLPDLRGKVAIVDFWTYSCINCQRALPHVQAWYSAYRAAGLEVIGVHTPEFAFEKDPDSVAQAISDQGIDFPVAMDNAGATWTNFHNRYWPALYLIDARGIVRHVSFGEGGYAATESLVRQLLIAADPAVRLPAPVEG
jgi:thiol-disulfide isomerase/thioredoxin